MRNLRIVLIVLVSLLAIPSVSIPFKNTTFVDKGGCTRSQNRYFIAVDATSRSNNYNDHELVLLRTLGVALLREPDNKVVICAYNSNYRCSDWISTESVVAEEIESGKFNIYTGTSSTSGFDEMLIFLMSLVDKEIPTKFILINNNENIMQYSLLASRLRDGGVEIFGTGEAVNTNYFVSHPVNTHFILTNSNAPRASIPVFEGTSAMDVASELLSLVRNQKSTICAAWGFGQTHIITFDGTVYDFNGVGDYYLFNSKFNGEDSLSVQIRQTPRISDEDLGDRVTQIRSVSVFYGDYIIIVTYEPEMKFITFKLKEKGSSDFETIDMSFNYYYNSWIPNFKYHEIYNQNSIPIIFIKYEMNTPEDSHQVEIYTIYGETVLVYFSEYSSGVIVRPNPKDYFASSGLCGFYDGCSNNDFMLRNNLVLDSKKILKKDSLMNEFLENWRVRYIESKLDLKNFESHLPSDSWKPFTSNKNRKNSDLVCSNLPEPLKEKCKFDVGARKNLYASLVSKFLIRNICSKYCMNPAKSYVDFFEVERYCKVECRSMEREVDLHFKYNTTYDLNDQVEDTYTIRKTENSLLFKSNVNMGGSYTFNLISRDLCMDNERNITFRLTCDEPPIVKAYSFFTPDEQIETDSIIAYYGEVGIPTIHLFGSIEGRGEKDYRISWKVVNASLPLYKEYREENYPEVSRVRDANEQIYSTFSLNPYFYPPWSGVFIIELSVNDGCQVVRSQVTVNITCSKCLLTGSIANFQKSSWNKNNNNNGNWPSISTPFRITSTSKDYNDYYYYYWRLVSKDGASIKKIDRNTYEAYIIQRASTIISDRQYSESLNPTTPIKTETLIYDPFTQPKSPYQIPELSVMKLKFEWSQTTTHFREIIKTAEEIDTLCRISANHDTYISSPQWTFTETVDLSAKLAKCTGYYTIDVEVYDGCDNTKAERSIKDSIILHLDCRLPPRTYLSCPHSVIFNYAINAFPSVSLDGSETYDPREGTPTNPTHLLYTWEVVTKPPTSTAKIATSNSRTNTFTPDTKGTYVISLTASNQCNKDTASVLVEAKCANPPSLTSSATPQAITYNGTQPAITLQANAIHDFQASLLYNWKMFQMPTYPEIYDFISIPSLQNSNTATATFIPTISGSYLVGIYVTDRCQPAINQNLSLTLNCESTATSVVSSIPATFNYNYSTFTFPIINLDASGSTITGAVSYTPVPRHRWYLVTAPGKTTWSTLSNLATYSYQTVGMGSYILRHAFTDSCRYTHSDVLFNVNCPNPEPVPVAAVSPSSTLITGNLVIVQQTATIVVSSISWILQDPSGKNISSYSNLYNITFTPTVPGKYVVLLAASDGCKIGRSSLSIVIGCPIIDYTPTPQINSPISLYSRGKFAKVTVNEAGTSLGVTYLPANFNYRWTIVEAPVGSAYEPFDKINSSQTITILPAVVNATLNITSYRVVTNYVREIRYVEIKRATNPEKIFSACFHPDIQGVYKIRLQISAFGIDDPCYSKNSTDLTVEARCNGAPIISVPDQTVELKSNKFDRVTIDASANTVDPEGDPLTYSWRFVQDYTDKLSYEPILSQTNSPVLSFVVFVQGSYQVELTVSDGCSIATKIITVTLTCPSTIVKDEKTLKKEEEMRNIQEKFDGRDLSFKDFEYLEKEASHSCTGMIKVEFVSFDNKDIIRTVPFSETKGFLVTVVVVPIVGVILIAVAAFVIYKFVVNPSKSSEVPMTKWE